MSEYMHVGNSEDMQKRVERIAAAYGKYPERRPVLIKVLRRLSAAAVRYGMI